MPKDNSPSNPSPSPPPYRTVERMRYFILPLNSTAKTWWLISWPKWSSPPRTPSCLSNDLQFNCMDISGNHRYTYAHIYYIYTHIYASTHTRAPILEQGPVSRRRDLTPHRLSIRRRCRNSAIFAFCSALQQRHGSALPCIAKIPITRNRILTHVYKYLNAFIIHIYTHRRPRESFRRPIYMYAISFTHTHTLRLLLWC